MKPNRHFQKISWKLTQVNLCSIFDLQHYKSGHFKDFKVSTISIKYNYSISSLTKCKISNQTHKLPNTVNRTTQANRYH